MTKQGWKEGQSLGNRESVHVGLNDVDRLAAARVGVLFKDNNLGLGAKHKSKDIEGQRTGLDAFQGLLGRLNGKSDQELQKEEQKVEDRKLAMYAKGRWGGMVFVKGGTLVGDRDFGTGEKVETAELKDNSPKPVEPLPQPEDEANATDSDSERTRRKEAKKQRKEARKLKRDERALRKAAKKAKQQDKSVETSSADEDDSSTPIPFQAHKSSPSQAPDEPVSSSSGAEDTSSSKLKRKRSSLAPAVSEISKQKPTMSTPLRNGRHLLRGRNIQAKKMAFADMKGLDEIFMKTG